MSPIADARRATDRDRDVFVDRAGARWRQASPWVKAGVPLLLAAVVVVQAGVRPWVRDRTVEADRAVARATARSGATVPAPDAPAGDDATAWWSSLPAADAASADLEAIVAAARESDVPVQRAQVRRVEAPAALRVEEVELDLEAPYPATRRFLARTLNRLPHAALARLRLEREGGAREDDAAAGAGGRVRTTVILRLHHRVGAAP